jgi:ATP-dependent RNA circularization protein (DNA/RNA ligase family)
MSAGRSDFFKFPHTPHLAWLSKTPPRVDKVLTPRGATDFLSGEVVVEEKVDGANVGLSVSAEGEVIAQSRGSMLGPGAHPQFEPLWPWLARRRYALAKALSPGRILFGEWCFAVHSIQYTKLPDWFLGFDVFDTEAGRFWSTRRRDELLEALGIARVPRISQGTFDLRGLIKLLGPSYLTDKGMEGLYVRRDEGEWLLCRAKIVRAEFVQSIEEHWSSRRLEKNTLVTAQA